jgi:kelch-like protein 20
MQPILKFTTCVVLLVMIIPISCKKEPVQVTTPPPTSGNQPPVAHAGEDQTITLPVSSVTLDGSKSTDPENKIIIYTWSRLAGASSAIISNSVQTPVTNLRSGIYQFELKVTDHGGLTAKDTVMVTVLSNFGACSEDSILIVKGTATITPIGTLSQARYVQAATALDKLVFAGGLVDGGPGQPTAITDRVDIYNLSTQTWSTTKLSEPRNGLKSITVGNKIVFASGEWNGNNVPKSIEIYDAALNTWSSVVLSSPLYNSRVLVSANNKVFITATNYLLSTKLDIYDAASNALSTSQLSQARFEPSATANGNRVFFAGGYQNTDWDDNPIDFSARVDICDASTNTWSTAELSEARYGIAAASIANKIIFAGGYGSNNASNRIDIYDVMANTWSTASLSEPRSNAVVATVGNKLLFAGGYSNSGQSAKVDIYDATTNSWSVANLSQHRQISSAVTLGNKVLFFTSYYGFRNSNIIDIYDAANNTWSTAELNKSFSSFAIKAGNQIFIGGGTINSVGFNSDYRFACQVLEFKF